jgi:hypothetical protein
MSIRQTKSGACLLDTLASDIGLFSEEKELNDEAFENRVGVPFACPSPTRQQQQQ